MTGTTSKETRWCRYAINIGAEWIVYDSPRGWPVGAGYIKARGLSEDEMQEYLDCWEGEVREGWE